MAPSTPFTPSSHSHNPPSHPSTTSTTNEHTTLLPHSLNPVLEPYLSTPQPTAHTTANPQHIPQRVAELEHIISRIDTIEIGLWQNRVAQGDSCLFVTAPVEATEWEQERLSRVSTYIGRVASRHKLGVWNGDGDGDRDGDRDGGGGRAIDEENAACASEQDPHMYFWADLAGVAILGLLVAGMLLYVGVSVLAGKGRWCDLRSDNDNVVVFVVVQVLVSMAFGFLTEIRNRWVVPFVLPLWVLGVLGTMVGLRVLVCGM